MSNLIPLGYRTPELQWFQNATLLLNKNKHTNKTIFHPHFPDVSYDIKYKMVLNNLKAKRFPAYFNDVYTATILASMLHNGFDSWANYNVHLDYNTILHNFYTQENVEMGNKLLAHSFVKPDEYKQLQHFRSIQRDSKICPTDVHQLLMMARIKN